MTQAEYKKIFFIHEIKSCLHELRKHHDPHYGDFNFIDKLINKQDFDLYFKVKEIKDMCERNTQENKCKYNTLSEIIDAFIWVTNLLHMHENAIYIYNLEKEHKIK